MRPWIVFVYTGGAVGYVKCWTRWGAERVAARLRDGGEDCTVLRRDETSVDW